MDASIQKRLTTTNVQADPVQMDIATLFGAFVLLIVGWTVSFVVFLFEIIIAYVRKMKINSMEKTK